MSQTAEQENKLYYPPGGILIWLIIILEVCTFLGALLVFAYQRSIDTSSFDTSQELLNPLIGTINTIILISSGYFMAVSVSKLRAGENQKATSAIFYANLLGIAFLVLKSFEYYQKMDSGITFTHTTFFTFYWLMTGFHFVHVLFGVGLLTYMHLAMKKNKYSSSNMADIEATATYWHMCDLIWILIFPVLYLL